MNERNAIRIKAFANSVYLATRNKYYDDFTTEDGVIYLAQIVDWINQYLDELEMETDEDGNPIDWDFARRNDVIIGRISATNQRFSLNDGILRLVVDENRPLVIMQDGTIISHWNVVPANIITRTNTTDNLVSVVNGVALFSRPLNETELGGNVVADVIDILPRVTDRDTTILDTVKPKQLLILGVAKNATLPDITQGGISPSLTQKYADLLSGAKAKNSVSSISGSITREDFSNIGGVY